MGEIPPRASSRRPFQTWFMKNKCCSACRINRGLSDAWDLNKMRDDVHAAVLSTLFGLLALGTTTFLGCGLVGLLIRWKTQRSPHTRRFSEKTNITDSSPNCTEKTLRLQKAGVRWGPDPYASLYRENVLNRKNAPES